MTTELHHDVVIIGGGSAGIATASSMLRRRPSLDLAIVEPREDHYYQPGWTMVGAGVFEAPSTCHSMSSVMPAGARWLRQAATSFQPDANRITLADGTTVSYRVLVVAPGIRLAWEKVHGLEEALGRNGVTSNYRYDLAPYTWELVQRMKAGRAIFSQPPMPIKCAGAPQKAMYLSCDAWARRGVLGAIDVEFRNAGAALFGVKEYVPALLEYVGQYGIGLKLNQTLIAVDGPAGQATFQTPDGEETVPFDLLHAVPPQVAPSFVADSPLAHAENGFVDVDKFTLRHVRYPNVFGAGDACSAPNAKTAAAARKQAPVVALNALAALDGDPPVAQYDGYGSCPLTVERGKVVLAEFGYDGKLLPTFPRWIIDSTRPSRLAWLLKTEALPWIYWHGMLRGREWLVAPQMRAAA